MTARPKVSSLPGLEYSGTLKLACHTCSTTTAIAVASAAARSAAGSSGRRRLLHTDAGRLSMGD